MFVHRNVGNLVSSDDPNIKAVIDYAILELKVEHIIVCGHYECGAVKASLKGIENLNSKDLRQWLKPLSKLTFKLKDEHDSLSENQKHRRLVEINVIEQCNNVSQLKNVQELYKLTGNPLVHGWVYDLPNGELIDLNF